MRQPKTLTQTGLRGFILAMITVTMTVGLGSWHKATATVAQPNLTDNQSRVLGQADPGLVAPTNTSTLDTSSLDDSSISSAVCPSDLDTTIAAIIEHPKFATAQWGIVIEPLSEPTPLYRYNSDTALIPASNIKLLTTAAALLIVSERAPQNVYTLEGQLTVVNRDSNNASADALLRSIGGQSVVNQALATLGVSPESYAQVDGSGLSRNNRVEPSALLAVLKGMYTHDTSGLFYRSLSVAGVNGTLRNRFRQTPVQGRLHAKTGTLQGVRALSGYLENDSYGLIAFSIVVNQPGQSGQTMIQAIDQIVLQTAQVTRCD